MPRGIWAFFFSSSIYRKNNWEWRRILGFQFFQALVAFREERHVPGLDASTSAAIAKECSKNGWEHAAHTLPGNRRPPAVLHEIPLRGNSAQASVLLYFHGGGYKNPLQGLAHVPSARDYSVALGASAVFLLEYSLTPGAQYPTQLQQAVSAVRYLLQTRGLDPSQIVVGGDSAGGHLALTLIAHLLRENPKVESLQEVMPRGARFRGLCLISPWVSMDTSASRYASYRDYDAVDLVNSARMTRFKELFSPSADIWADPSLAGDDFWAQAPVESIIITCGGIEGLRDSIIETWRQLAACEKTGTKLELVVAKGEVHVHLAFDYALGLLMCESRKALLHWFKNMR